MLDSNDPSSGAGSEQFCDSIYIGDQGRVWRCVIQLIPIHMRYVECKEDVHDYSIADEETLHSTWKSACVLHAS